MLLLPLLIPSPATAANVATMAEEADERSMMMVAVVGLSLTVALLLVILTLTVIRLREDDEWDEDWPEDEIEEGQYQ